MAQAVEIEIHRFEPSDTQSVIDLILSIQRDEFRIPITIEQQPDLSSIPAFYQVDQGDFWVATNHGRVIGTIGLKDIGNSQAALRKMFVAEAFRGGKFGVAAQLLARLLSEARERGIAEIFLGTTDKFVAAHRFYEKHGFREIPEDRLPKAFPLMPVDTKFYLLSFAESQPLETDTI